MFLSRLSIDLTQKVRVLRTEDLMNFIDPEGVPTFLDGKLEAEAHFDAWIATLKEFYETELQPKWSGLVKDEAKIPPDNDMWDPPVKKKEEKKEKKEKKDKKAKK